MRSVISILTIIFFNIMPIYAEQCPLGMYPVKEHPRDSYIKQDGTHVSATEVSEHCRNYRNDGPLKTVYQKNRPPSWPNAKEKLKKCTSEESKQINSLLKSLPKILTEVGKLKILCGEESIFPNNPATTEPKTKTIVLYRSALTSDTKRILLHELAHILYERLSSKERKSYWGVAEWNKNSKTGTLSTNKILFTAYDGSISPEEDFANDLEYLITEPQRTKQLFPQTSTWFEIKLGIKP